MDKTAVIFICQEGLLEAQSIILAISLRKHLRGNYKLVCAIPENIGKICHPTIILLKEFDVEIRYFTNDFKPLYFLANKCLACNLDVGCERKIFIDSDIVCTGDFDVENMRLGDLYTQLENPYCPLTEKNWRDVSNLFQVDLLSGDPLKRCLNDPLISFNAKTGFEKKWLENMKSLHRSYHKNEINIKNGRKISRLSYIAATKQCRLEVHAEDPFSWNEDVNWWQYPRCSCHRWEKAVPIWERKFNKVICQPDHVFGSYEGKPLTMGVPKFLILQEGIGYCEKHQGKMTVKTRQTMGLACYPFIRSMLYGFLSEHPVVDQLECWPLYHKRYFDNDDKIWFKRHSHSDNMFKKAKAKVL